MPKAGATDPPDKRPSTELGIHIQDTRQKIEFFFGRAMTGPEGPTQCVHQFSFSDRKAMSSWLGFANSDRLKPKAGEDKDSYRLSKEVIAALAKKLGFDPEWGEWKTGSWHAFANKYNAKNTFEAKVFTCEKAKPDSRDNVLASVSVIIEQNRITLPASFKLDLTCDKAPEGDLEIWIRSALLEMTIGKAGETVPSNDRKRFPKDYPALKKLKPECTLEPGGDCNEPYWQLKTAQTSFGSLTLEHFIDIVDIEDDGVLEIRLGVYVKDLAAIPPPAPLRSHAKPMRNGDTHSFRWVTKGGNPILLVDAKTAIEQRLAICRRQERQLVGASVAGGNTNQQPELQMRRDGYLVLASHRVTFKRADQNDY